MRFVDTNILLYAISTAADETSKAKTAREILNSEDLGLSVQVLQEFYVQATRHSRQDPLEHHQATSLIEAFARYPVQTLDLGIVRAALDTRRRFDISYWDAAILEAARKLGCDVVLSEDLQDGQDYAGLIVQNPFEA
jgi:predicted nucleic acid-binding protein